jgi:hypothetical protein
MVTDELRDNALIGPTNYADAQASNQSLGDFDQLGDNTIRTFAEEKKYEEITATLAQMCNVSVDVIQQAMLQDKPETILILAKAAKLSWPTTKTLLSFCIRHRRISSVEIEQCLASFERLNLATSLKIVEFYKIRKATCSTRPA